MDRLLRDMQNHPQAWPFLTPVNAEDVPDYYEVIKEPMGMLRQCLRDTCLLNLKHRLQNNGTQARDQTILVA